MKNEKVGSCAEKIKNKKCQKKLEKRDKKPDKKNVKIPWNWEVKK